MQDREFRLMEIAYLIWEAEGRPIGQAERHWRMAKSALEQEEAERTQRKIVEGEPPGDAPADDAAEFPPLQVRIERDRHAAPNRSD